MKGYLAMRRGGSHRFARPIQLRLSSVALPESIYEALYTAGQGTQGRHGLRFIPLSTPAERQSALFLQTCQLSGTPSPNSNLAHLDPAHDAPAGRGGSRTTAQDAWNGGTTVVPNQSTHGMGTQSYPAPVRQSDGSKAFQSSQPTRSRSPPFFRGSSRRPSGTAV